MVISSIANNESHGFKGDFIMIEIICENEEKNEENQSVIRSGIRLPKNVKQIGEPPQGRRIYIEDYVYTYITSMAGDMGGYGTGRTDINFYGLLLGETKKSSQETCIFIRSAVRFISQEENQDFMGANVQENEDMPEIPAAKSDEISFSQDVWTNLYDSVEKYFKGQEILGWFLCADSRKIVADPENPTLAPWVQKLHFDNFAGATKTFFLVDPNSHEEFFYMVENGKLTRQGGFICFYERNEAMQEYMLATRPPRSVDNNINDRVIQNFRTIIQEKKEEAEKHQSISVMYGICAFMIVVVTVIGINMMNSYEKMQTLDDSMNKIAREIANMNVDSENFAGSEKTPVTKIDGKVYPTSVASSEAQKETEAPAATTAPTAAPAAATAAGTDESEKTKPAATVTPTESALTKPAETVAATAAKRTYVVEKGDTLMSICKNVYGDSLKYKDIMEINKLDNPDKIFIGQVIVLP